MEILSFFTFSGIFTSVICLTSHLEPEHHLNLTSSHRQLASIRETTAPKSSHYPHYIQAPYDYIRDFDGLLSRSSIPDSHSDAVRGDPNFIDLEMHQKKLASQHLPQVTLYRLSPYSDPLSYYGGHESDAVSLKKHDFVRGNQGWNLGGWDNFQGGYNMGGHGNGGGGLRKGKEAKALFILMAPLILLAVFGPILATQAMLPWVTNGGLTTVSTIAGGKRRRRRATAVDYRQVAELDRRLQLFLEVQEFLAKSGSPDLIEEMGEAFMHCQKYTERRNKCLERAACEYTDITSELNREERRIGRLVLRNVMSNPVVPASLIGRLKKGHILAKNHPGRCSTYWCEALDGPKTKLTSEEEEESSRTERLLHLIENLSDESFFDLQVKVNKYLECESGSQYSFILMVSKDQQDISCTVISDKVLEERLTFPIQSNSFTTAIKEKRSLSLDDIKQDQISVIESSLGCNIEYLLCVSVPCAQKEENVSMIVCLLNKDDFCEDDENLVRDSFKCLAPILLRAEAYEEEKRLREECQSLLTVAKNLFTHLDDVTLLLREIMAQARHLTKAERCSLFLLEKERNELVAKVFDGNVAEDGTETSTEVRIPANQGIAGYVATTGELLNIHDAYGHPLFYRKMDETTGFKTRNILCFPIKDEKDVIGVAELCNKINERCFSYFDEEIAKAFAIYCGISIMHSLMWKKVRDSQHRSRLSNELMMYHMQVPPEEVAKLTEMEIPRPEELRENFAKLTFIPRSLNEQDTVLAVLSMFEDMGMIYKWRIPRTTLSKFVLMVKKGYRDPPYHNWMHAFAVGHFCYLMHKNVDLMGNNYLSELESLALFVACLCHDLDHRGTNNNFQVTSKSDLAALYCSEGSVMERHHFAQAMAILNTDGCNILENLSRKEYTQCLDCMRDVILATDLAHHLRIIEDIEMMAKEGYDVENQKHHQLLMCLLITCCDLSDQTKDWKSSKKIAELIYSEFFSQGDLEKAMGVHPSEMMDREKACIPELQIGFIENIVHPAYKILASLFPQVQDTLVAVETNRLFWERMRDVYKRRYSNSTSSLDMFEDESLEQEVLAALSCESD